MGALPGGGLLSGPGAVEEWFDVEPFRGAGRRVVVRTVDRRVLVLGSTQPATVVDRARAECSGVTLARRRSGGGAVLLEPGGQVWVDVWVPRGDRLWSDDPRRSAELVGDWWAAALQSCGARDVRVHRSGSVPAPGSDLVCFAGLGPGEVIVDGAKLVGLAQWRSRQGTLVHGCAYRWWEPAPLTDLLAMDDGRRAALRVLLEAAALGLDQTDVSRFEARALLGMLPDPESWEVVSA